MPAPRDHHEVAAMYRDFSVYLGDEPLEIDIDGAAVKVRDPWRVGMFSLITLGIYSIVWFYKVNRELDDYAHHRGARRRTRAATGRCHRDAPFSHAWSPSFHSQGSSCFTSGSSSI
jgi:hypothetical protein